MNFGLIKNILELSESPIWDIAKKEWEIKGIVYLGKEDGYETCLCGHYPIKEVINIQNKENHNEAVTGNCCINKIKDVSFVKSFTAIKKGKINSEIIEFAYSKGFINTKSYEFALDVWRKRNLSGKQMKWLDDIKNIILTKLKGGYEK